MNRASEYGLSAGSSTIEESSASTPALQSVLNWLPTVEWCVLASLAVVFVGLALVPGWRSLKSEFPDYYLAAELYHQRIPLDRVYEWAWFQRQNDHLAVRDGLVSFAPNPPTSILPLLPLTTLTPLNAKRVWMVSNLILLALSLLALRHATQLGWRRLILITLFEYSSAQGRFHVCPILRTDSVPHLYRVLRLLPKQALDCRSGVVHRRGHEIVPSPISDPLHSEEKLASPDGFSDWANSAWRDFAQFVRGGSAPSFRAGSVIPGFSW